MAADSASFTVDTETDVTIGDVDPTTGVITGTGEPGAEVVITVDGVEVGTVTVGVDGTWSFDGDVLGALAHGDGDGDRPGGQHGDGHHHGDGGEPGRWLLPDGGGAASRAARCAPRTPRWARAGRRLAGSCRGPCARDAPSSPLSHGTRALTGA